jgi:uncharacterized protein YeaC (DUF1315 family)
VIDKPQSWQDLLASMTPEIHQNLKTAVELGKWPNGDRLTAEQVELCLQAVIAYDQQYLPEAERVAFMHITKVKKQTAGEA